MYALGYPFSFSAVYNSVFAFISCLSGASKLARGEKLGLSRVFSGHIHSPSHEHVLLYPWEYVGILQSTLWMSYSLDLLSFWARLLFATTSIATPGNYECFSTNVLGRGLFSWRSWAQSNEDKLCGWKLSRLLLDRSNCASTWRWGSGGAPTCSASSGDC